MTNHHEKIVGQQIESYDSYLKIRNNPRYQKAARYIFENSRGDERVLDIGCSNGDFCEALVESGYECHGIEIVDEAITEAVRKGVRVKRSSFLNPLPYDEGTFDFVFAGEVIEHTLDDVQFLLETYRVLRTSGVLILTTPNLLSLGNRILMLLGRMPRFAYADFHYQIYSPKVIVSKVRECGFDVIRLDSSYVLVSTHFNSTIGMIGEWLGSRMPGLGEHIIVYAKKIPA